MERAAVVAFLVASGVLLLTFLAVGAGRWYQRLAVPLAGVGSIAVAGLAVETLTESQCGALLRVVGQGGSGGFLTFHCLGLFVTFAAITIVALDLACLAGLFLRASHADSRARGDR